MYTSRGKFLPCWTDCAGNRLNSVFNPPMVIFSEGFTSLPSLVSRVLFQASLRSITGPESDADLLRFLTAVLGSRLMQYQAFHSGSSNGIGRDKMHLYESLQSALSATQPRTGAVERR